MHILYLFDCIDYGSVITGTGCTESQSLLPHKKFS